MRAPWLVGGIEKIDYKVGLWDIFCDCPLIDLVGLRGSYLGIFCQML